MRVGQIYGNNYLNSGAELSMNNQVNNLAGNAYQNSRNINLTSQHNSASTEEIRGCLAPNLSCSNIQSSQNGASSNASHYLNNNNYYSNRVNGHNYNGYNYNDHANSLNQSYISTNNVESVHESEQKGGFVTSLTKPIQSRVDPSQIPRPVFGNITEKECNIYDSDKYTFPPNSLNEPHSMILDRGNATSKYYKLTLNQIPSQHSILQSMKLPCAAIIQPFPLLSELDKPVPIVNSSITVEPIRCVRCRAYANPFTCVSQNGDQCLCNFCGHTFDIPMDYLRLLQSQIKTQNYQNDDQLNYPEIYHGVVDYYAPASLGLTAEPELPCYCFLIEISSYSYQNNIINMVIYCLKHILNQLSERSPETNVILIFYSREIILFPYQYNKNSPSQIKMSVISDIMEPFIPCPLSEICIPVSEAINYLNELLDKAPDLLKSHITPNNAYYSALSLAIQIFQLKKCTGTILTFISSIPNIGIASINNKEVTIAPKSPPRRTSKGMKQSVGFVSGYVVHNIQQLDLLIQQCKSTNVSVETFVITQINNNINDYINNNASMLPTSTLSYIPQHTGGKLRLFSDFSFEKIYNDVYKILYSIFFIHNVAYDCTFKLRCSKGIAVSKVYAPWTAGGPTPDLTAFQIPKIDSNTAIAFLLRHEENLDQKKNVYLQAACLYTCKDKRVRLLRVLTISIPVTTSITTAFRYASIEPIVNIYARMAAHHIVSKGQRIGGKGNGNNNNNSYSNNSNVGICGNNSGINGSGVTSGSGMANSIGGIGTSIGNTINNSLNINNLVPGLPFSSSKNSNNLLLMWKQETLNSVIDMLFSYRENCANTSSTGQLILPDSLKLTLIYISSLFKCPALMPLNTVLEFSISEQIVGLYELLHASVSYTTALLYPRLYPIHHSLISNENNELQRLDSVGIPYQITMQFSENNNDNTLLSSNLPELPVISRFWLNSSIACSGERILSDGIYILENGREIYIYIGSQVDSNIINDLFGVDNINSDNFNKISLITESIEMDVSKMNIRSRISNIIQQIRTDRFSISTYMPVIIVSNYSQKLESKLKALLVEDPYGCEMSYVDFLCNVHKLVQSKLVDS
ncbi:SEC24C-like component of COPII coatamer of ER-golgi vesicles [Cryptosporidium bovis]|uniref:SEC24C-like component of COPII coatamer of ER-golgi vesicles n=1 Tax=Cryptosporidium bovis TaxID=310047 RepID=UPI00351A3308|nr:SEC24C-like component of COPII coatamer of ER-golgi vesicles [Cryptosporidium bovis]